MKLKDEMLKAIMPHMPKKARDAALPLLNSVAKHYKINTERRMAMWLATLALESGEFKYQEEIASGKAYEGRKDLGNTQKGDGVRFKGRGRIQGTGRDVYTAYTAYLAKSKHLPFVDFVAHPEMLAKEPYSTDFAGWFVNGYKRLLQYADSNNFLRFQIGVNGRRRDTGKPNHWAERQMYYARAIRALPDDFTFEYNEPFALIDDEAGAILEGQEDWPDFDVVDMESKDISDTPNGADLSDQEWQEGVRPTPTPESGSERLETETNGISTPEDKPVVEAGAAENATEADKAKSPQVVIKETPSLFTKVMAGIFSAIATGMASLTSYCGGNEVVNEIGKQGAQKAVEGATRSDVTNIAFILLWVALGLGAAILLFWIAAKIYEGAAKRAHELNVEKLNKAADTNVNTVEFIKK